MGSKKRHSNMAPPPPPPPPPPPSSRHNRAILVWTVIGCVAIATAAVAWETLAHDPTTGSSNASSGAPVSADSEEAANHSDSGRAEPVLGDSKTDIVQDPHPDKPDHRATARPHTVDPETAKKLLAELNRLAYSGDYASLRKLVARHSQTDWSAIVLAGKGLRTPIHIALQGRHDSLSQQSLDLIGQHEEVIRFLTNEMRLDAAQGCPVYHALHYRNLRALDTLLQAAGKERSLECLTTLDSNGETALHSASKSKASGLARFFAKLITSGSTPNPKVMDLLGLRPLKTPQSRVLTHAALNMAVTHRDIRLVLSHLGAMINLSSLLDHHGNTLLHNAAYGGRGELVQYLLELGLSADAVNRFGLAPLDLALAGHFCDIVDILVARGAKTDTASRAPAAVVSYGGESCEGSTAVEPQRAQELDSSAVVFWERYRESGWVDRDRAKRLWSDRERDVRCNMDIRNTSLTHEELSLYKDTYRPVVLQGLMEGWRAWEHWTKDQLVERYGRMKFSVSDIPYAELYYGASARTTLLSMSDYITSFSEQQAYPRYLFDGQVLHWDTELAAAAPMPTLFNNFTVALKQFILGPKNSGSPPHFHRHALNALVYGLKLWHLWPPSEAHFVFQHAHRWQEDSERRGAAAPVECVQRPGDIVFVPEGWGHAVVNLEDSIGVAYELA